MAKARMPLDYSFFQANLVSHPDKEFVNFILTGISQGVDIGYKGPQRSLVSGNWPSSTKNHDKVSEAIQAHIDKGRVAGPWAHPPFDYFVSSPLGAVPKKNSTKVRVIHDLSWPPTLGVNSGIDINEFSLKYIKIDDIIHKCQSSIHQPFHLLLPTLIVGISWVIGGR